jgi:hypothetical protein
MNIVKGDFQPYNNWKLDTMGEKWSLGFGCKLEPKFIIDQTTNRRYFNESKGVVGFKCFLLSIGTPFIHGLASIANIAYRILKIVTLAHLWLPKDGEKSYQIKQRLHDLGFDCLRIIATPLTYVCLEMSALYGLFTPYNGRKLYASIERAAYGNFILAPCFQPDAKYHALGGDINKKNAF